MTTLRARRRRRRRSHQTVKRATYISPREAVRQTLNQYDDRTWSYTHLSPLPQTLRVAKSYMWRAPYQPEALAPLNRARPRAPDVQALHDTPFKRPRIDPYEVWRDGLAYISPQATHCVQRKSRREAIFATTGGGKIAGRSKTNRRTRYSQLGCK